MSLYQMDPSGGEVTRLLHAWGSGDRSVEERLFSLVLPDLHKLARHLMSGERKDHSLQPTALMNEAYFRLVGARMRDWENRRHFFAVAARAMRHLLIDHARARSSGAKVSLEGFEELLKSRDSQLQIGVEIHTLLEKMEEKHADWCPIVDLKFFAGFTDQEIAEALNVPLRTVQRQFSDARRWLFERLNRECKATPNTTSA